MNPSREFGMTERSLSSDLVIIWPGGDPGYMFVGYPKIVLTYGKLL
jgi:hypothetical protein